MCLLLLGSLMLFNILIEFEYIEYAIGVNRILNEYLHESLLVFL